MARPQDTNKARRQFLMLFGGSAIVGLTGCSGGEDASAPASGPASSSAPSSAPSSEPAAAETATSTAPETGNAPEPEAAAEATEAPAAVTDLPHLSPDDPTAKSLGYVHDSSTVDQSAYPRHAAEQRCANCALFQGGDAEWGACSIFPGRAVKATGWCSAYAPKTG